MYTESSEPCYEVDKSIDAGAWVTLCRGWHPCSRLFNHWAGEHDTNRYFTFPERGEDLLALGTIADGVFSDYHYRHPTYAEYCRNVTDQFPGLQGGLRRNALENRLHPLVTNLLAGHVPVSMLQKNISLALMRHWQDAALLIPAPGGDFQLSGNGSWFVGNMITQLAAQQPKTTATVSDRD